MDATDERLDIVILDWKCFALETARLKPLDTAVLLICCVWCLTNDQELTQVSPYTVRSMAFLPRLRLARTWHCRSPLAPIPPVVSTMKGIVLIRFTWIAS